LIKDIEIAPAEEDELINKIAEKIHDFGMEVVAILLLETVKPLSYIGGQMGHVLIFPYLPFFGDNISQKGKKLFATFEKPTNVEKLIGLLENMVEKKPEKSLKNEQSAETKDVPEKSGWRRFLQF